MSYIQETLFVLIIWFALLLWRDKKSIKLGSINSWEMPFGLFLCISHASAPLNLLKCFNSLPATLDSLGIDSLSWSNFLFFGAWVFTVVVYCRLIIFSFAIASKSKNRNRIVSWKKPVLVAYVLRWYITIEVLDDADIWETSLSIFLVALEAFLFIVLLRDYKKMNESDVNVVSG